MTSAGTTLFRCGALCLALLLPLLQGLGGCQQQAQHGAGLPPAPQAQAARSGSWAGGPEPLSGKLRSGIVSWWRLLPAQPQAGQAFQLQLRLDDVQGAGASVSVTTSDGARLADAAAPRQWALQAGQPAQISLALVAPAGDSYLHVATQQNGRSSVRSILLALPAIPPSAPASAAASTNAGR